MHLLYVSQVELLEHTGQARFDRNFLDYLVKRSQSSDFSFQFIGPRSSKESRNTDNMSFIPLRKTALGFILFQLRLLFAILAARKIQRFDAIYVRFHPLMLAPYVYARISDTPLYLRTGPIVPNLRTYQKTRSKLLTWLVTLNCKVNFKLARSIIVVTKQIESWVLSNFLVDRTKLHVVSNGVDLQLFDPSRFEQRASANSIRFGLVCTVHPSQGLEALLESFVGVVKARADCTLDIAGGGDNVFTKRIQLQISQLGLEKHVRLLGNIAHAEVAKVIHDRDIMLLPVLAEELARTGSSSLKLFEYLAMNRFVVASRHPDHQFIEDNRLGILYQAGSSAALTTAIIHSIELFRAAEENERIRRYCVEHFSSDHCFGRYISIIVGRKDPADTEKR